MYLFFLLKERHQLKVLCPETVNSLNFFFSFFFLFKGDGLLNCKQTKEKITGMKTIKFLLIYNIGTNHKNKIKLL